MQRPQCLTGEDPGHQLDASWIAGLSMATHNGIQFETRATFSFGPLGFLTNPIIWFGHVGVAAFAYQLVIQFAAALALFAGARRTFGGLGAFFIAVVVASVDTQLLQAVAFLIGAVWAITAGLNHREAIALSLAAGAVAGFELLNKISIGISLTAMAAVFVLSLPGRRRDYALAAAGVLLSALRVGPGSSPTGCHASKVIAGGISVQASTGEVTTRRHR